MSNPQHLIHTIQQAFSSVTLGNGIGLSEGNAMDDYAPAEERARCRKQDEQTHWHKIPVELLNQYYVALCYFDQFSLLNAQQKQAVAQYLRWICTDPSHYTTADDTTAIEEALLLFWET